MNSSNVKELSVLQCWPYDPGRAGFALPVLGSTDTGDLRFVQIINELTNHVEEFRLIDNISTISPLITLTYPFLKIKKGQPPIYVFFDETNQPHVGPLTVIATILEKFLKTSQSAAVKLQIAELLGKDSEKRASRFQMRNLVLETSGSSAARAFYEGSALRTALWERLLSAAPEKSAKHILSVRSKIGATLKADGSVDINLDALSPEDRAGIDEEKIRKELADQFGEPRGDEDNEGISDHDRERDKLRVDEILKQARSAGRQEERIAIILDAILKDRATGLGALQSYSHDRAKFANWALHELRKRFLDGDTKEISLLGPSDFSDERIAADLMPKFFTQTFPMNRGSMLWILAQRLGQWPALNDAIAHVTDRSRSWVVSNYRDDIHAELTKHRKAKR